jgi:D-glycero-D-manno-heptose 1,7-bisphosphate phosphatase
LTRRAVFLDRDGVINKAIVRDGKPYPPSKLEELEIVPGAQTVLSKLKNLGFVLIVVTNQPDISRGTQSGEELDRIHQFLRECLPLDDVLVCSHDDSDECDCRKPKPGLLLRGAKEHAVELADSFLIGDRWRDIDAGHAAGCKTALIDYRYRERGPSKEPDIRVSSLEEAVHWIALQ